MESLTFQEGYDQIVAYIKANGGVYSKWYVGVALDAKTRLFTDYKVSSVDGAWIQRTCESDLSAHLVEEALLRRDWEGGAGSGGDGSTQVLRVHENQLDGPIESIPGPVIE